LSDRTSTTLKLAIGGAVLLAGGIALGALVTRSPIQGRIPGGMAPPMLPTLLPFAAAALSFPLFLILSRHAPMSRSNWRRALPLWLLTLVVVAFVADALVFAVVVRDIRRVEPLRFLLMRLLSTGPIIAMSAAAAAAFENANARSMLVQAQLRSLTAQLRPHFLFNTLQSISTLVHRDADAADRMIGQLADLLRASLELDESTLVPLRREMEITEAYLAIVRERFGSRIDAEVTSTAPEEALVPPFLLQPLVENAVQHGIEAATGTGSVSVFARTDRGRLIMEVRNTDTEATAASNGAGIGMSTTRQRLTAIYGDRAELAMTSTDGSTTVTITLPLQP
jgi:hypothetical protein